MATQSEPTYTEAGLEAGLKEVRALMAKTVGQTSVGNVVSDHDGLVGSGKMLRSRMAFRVGPAAGVPHNTLVTAAAAVEMIHAASLLHDDVIDGGHLRRSVPTFWVERGVPAAILVGDLMLFKALDLLASKEDGDLTLVLIRATGDVCDAESEQELVLRGAPATWENCVSIARRKTGALFGFIAFACGGQDNGASAALMEAGSKIGTAYQLADDILDATGDPEKAGKTLGSDESREKTTAVSAMASDACDPVAFIEELCADAESLLVPWPAISTAWRTYMTRDLRPALDKNIASFSRRSRPA